MTFTGEELDTFRGPVCLSKIDIVRKYIAAPTNCWTARELLLESRLKEFMDFVETILKSHCPIEPKGKEGEIG